MTKYQVDFEFVQFGNVDLEADTAEDAEDRAIDYVADLHSIDPTDVTVVGVQSLA